ncbi:23S rRNA (guanosine-2'-O-) -methyltransferase rlmB [Mesobacillus selenatarsenatis SF-1]|uniref:23S rRNA (Guanosine-2'-O-)-methyltransferase rlmB n=1 Tax=Mesobacillus selenatarsenatis (strain DSM 18680 / JCM 14380 / FERM P-15431 / SF-1) TaxID=1321606 RepID=A0A0A8X4H1_MESS1|nr:23S rRNA (guanosine-2'-O-) -methyltransferase rlmB [Mesobacillus selenatarsenatis SF-1]
MSQKQSRNNSEKPVADKKRKPARNQDQRQDDKPKNRPARGQDQKHEARRDQKHEQRRDLKNEQRRDRKHEPRRDQKHGQKPDQLQEQNENQDYIIGKNPVIEALKSERDINKILIAEGSQSGQMQQVIGMAKEANVIVQFVPKKKIDHLADGNHQGVIAQVAAYEYAEIDDLFAAAEKKNEAPFFLLLDEIEDPHNLGSIMRTADASGAHGIIIPKRRAVGLTTTVAKLSTGAIEYIPVARVTNMAQTIDELKERGVWIAGTDASAKQDFRQIDGTLPLGLVIGSEGKGMGRLIRDKCDFLLSLPMVGHVTSLNASVAAALLMYEVHRKRHPLGE